ncbi:MAG: hypothetical protein U9R27_07255 [Campylobacterota bacterium]|nr:hypothetical protein [Campylobacterota bacterium]
MVVSEMDYKVADDTILRPDIALVCGQTTGSYIKKSSYPIPKRPGLDLDGFST